MNHTVFDFALAGFLIWVLVFVDTSKGKLVGKFIWKIWPLLLLIGEVVRILVAFGFVIQTK